MLLVGSLVTDALGPCIGTETIEHGAAEHAVESRALINDTIDPHDQVRLRRISIAATYGLRTTPSPQIVMARAVDLQVSGLSSCAAIEHWSN